MSGGLMFYSRKLVLTGLCSTVLAAAFAGKQTQAKSQDADDAARYTQRAMLSTVDTVTPENAQAKLVADAVATMSKTAFNGYAASARESVLGEMAGSSRLQVGNKDKFAVAVPNVYLNIHEEDTLGSDVVGKLYSNNVAKVMRDDGSDWVMVKSGSVVGYVLKDYLVEGDEAALLSDLVKKNVAMVSDDCDEDEVEVHSYKGDYGVVSTVSQGEQITVEEMPDEDGDDGWVKVSTDSGTGYVRSEEVEIRDSYPVAESRQEEEERLGDANIKDIADDAQMKADEASAVAEAAAEKAEEARSVVDDEDTEPTPAQEKAVETAEAVARITLASADAAQVTADEARDDLQKHGSETGQAVADFALQFVGNPYVYGGSSLTNGTDCSGFTMSVYANFGVGLPHYDASQRGYGIGIDSLSNARPGDLICYYGHVGIYIGDGMLVHASNPRDGIKVSRADYRDIAAIRRILY